MADLPPETPPDPNSETQAHIPEFKREPRSLPIAGVAVIFLLLVVGAGLLTFAFVYGQQDTETRAIDGTVAAVISFTHTPTNTRPPTETPPPTNTPQPTDTATETPQPSETLADTAVPSATVAPTRTKAPISVQPTDVPPTAPPPPTSVPAAGTHGIQGTLTLCNPEKSSFATNIERICFHEKIVNTTNNPIYYGKLGVLITNLSTNQSSYHDSWTDVTIGPGCTGPSGTCGGPWEDGAYLNAPGSYRLALTMCYSKVDACVGGTGDWETFPSNIVVTTVDWTPSP